MQLTAGSNCMLSCQLDQTCRNFVQWVLGGQTYCGYDTTINNVDCCDQVVLSGATLYHGDLDPPCPTPAPTTPAPTASPTTPAPTQSPTAPPPTTSPTPSPTPSPTTPAPTPAPTIGFYPEIGVICDNLDLQLDITSPGACEAACRADPTCGAFVFTQNNVCAFDVDCCQRSGAYGETVYRKEDVVCAPSSEEDSSGSGDVIFTTGNGISCPGISFEPLEAGVTCSEMCRGEPTCLSFVRWSVFGSDFCGLSLSTDNVDCCHPEPLDGATLFMGSDENCPTPSPTMAPTVPAPTPSPTLAPTTQFVAINDVRCNDFTILSSITTLSDCESACRNNVNCGAFFMSSGWCFVSQLCCSQSAYTGQVVYKSADIVCS